MVRCLLIWSVMFLFPLLTWGQDASEEWVLVIQSLKSKKAVALLEGTRVKIKVKGHGKVAGRLGRISSAGFLITHDLGKNGKPQNPDTVRLVSVTKVVKKKPMALEVIGGAFMVAGILPVVLGTSFTSQGNSDPYTGTATTLFGSGAILLGVLMEGIGLELALPKKYPVGPAWSIRTERRTSAAK